MVFTGEHRGHCLPGCGKPLTRYKTRLVQTFKLEINNIVVNVLLIKNLIYWLVTDIEKQFY
jgi:hypothetical protein